MQKLGESFGENLTLKAKVNKSLPVIICYEINKALKENELNMDSLEITSNVGYVAEPFNRYKGICVCSSWQIY